MKEENIILKKYFNNHNININSLYDFEVRYFKYLNTLSESKLNEIFKDYKDDKEIIKSIELKIKEGIQKEDRIIIDDIKILDIINVLFNEIINDITYKINKYYKINNKIYEKYFYDMSINNILKFTYLYDDALEKYIKNDDIDSFDLMIEEFENEQEILNLYKDKTIQNRYNKLKFYIKEYNKCLPNIKYPDLEEETQLYQILPHYYDCINYELDKLNNMIKELQKKNEELKNKINK